MRLDDVTPVVLTRDEEANLERTLARLRWAQEVVVVDSGSRDRTRAIAEAAGNVRWIEHPFTDFTQQWSHAVHDTGIATEWVLTLDADYVLGDSFVAELQALQPGAEVAGYEAGFRYCMHGRPLRTSLYPPRPVLLRRARTRFVQDGHTQRVVADGEVRRLAAVILHDDRKPFSRWRAAQQRYAREEAAKLTTCGLGDLGLPDRLRRFYLGPLLMPFYCLLVRGLLLDGRAGLRYAAERTYAEAMLLRELLRRP